MINKEDPCRMDRLFRESQLIKIGWLIRDRSTSYFREMLTRSIGTLIQLWIFIFRLVDRKTDREPYCQAAIMLLTFYFSSSVIGFRHCRQRRDAGSTWHWVWGIALPTCGAVPVEPCSRYIRMAVVSVGASRNQPISALSDQKKFPTGFVGVT
jgi:hypothetical protein